MIPQQRSALISLDQLVEWLNFQAAEDLFSETLAVQQDPEHPEVLIFFTIYGPVMGIVWLVNNTYEVTFPSGNVIVYENPQSGRSH